LKDCRGVRSLFPNLGFVVLLMLIVYWVNKWLVRDEGGKWWSNVLFKIDVGVHVPPTGYRD
jgi:hypothetical protein